MERTRRGEAAKAALAAAEAIIPLLYECHCTNTNQCGERRTPRGPVAPLNACCATECSTLSPLTEHGEERLLRPPSLLLKLYRPAHEYCRPHREQD